MTSLGKAIGMFVLLAGLFLLAVAGLAAKPAHAHDWKRPDLDQWYSNLRNPHSSSNVIKSIGCCSQDDCHETDAEMRDNDWWAKIGHRTRKDGELQWVLDAWVKVPAEAILEKHDNPTGSAVICHSVAIGMGGEIVPAATSVWCFIPPTES